MTLLAVYRAMDRPGFEADRLHVNLYNRIQKTTAPLTAHVRARPHSIIQAFLIIIIVSI